MIEADWLPRETVFGLGQLHVLDYWDWAAQGMPAHQPLQSTAPAIAADVDAHDLRVPYLHGKYALVQHSPGVTLGASKPLDVLPLLEESLRMESKASASLDLRSHAPWLTTIQHATPLRQLQRLVDVDPLVG